MSNQKLRLTYNYNVPNDILVTLIEECNPLTSVIARDGKITYLLLEFTQPYQYTETSFDCFPYDQARARTIQIRPTIKALTNPLTILNTLTSIVPASQEPSLYQEVVAFQEALNIYKDCADSIRKDCGKDTYNNCAIGIYEGCDGSKKKTPNVEEEGPAEEPEVTNSAVEESIVIPTTNSAVEESAIQVSTPTSSSTPTPVVPKKGAWWFG